MKGGNLEEEEGKGEKGKERERDGKTTGVCRRRTERNRKADGERKRGATGLSYLSYELDREQVDCVDDGRAEMNQAGTT
jgi:hypothetical protein